MKTQGILFSNKKGISEANISDEMILARCQSVTASFDYCIEASPYSRQQVGFYLNIEEGTLNRMLNSHDRLNFPNDRIPELMAYCGNLIPVKYLALISKHGIHRLRSDVEDELERVKEQLRVKEHRESAIMDFLDKAKVSLNFGS